MARLPKTIIRKYGISKKAWAVYRASRRAKPKASRQVIKTARRRSYRRSRGRRSYNKSSKWGTVGTVAKMAIGAYMGQMIGGWIAKTVAKEGYSTPLVQGGAAFAGAVLVKKFAGRRSGLAAIGTGASAALALQSGMNFMAWWKARSANGG